MNKHFVAAAALCSILFATPAHANTILTYTGNTYDQYYEKCASIILQPCPPLNWFNKTMSITATIELLAPLGPDLDLSSVTPLYWSVNDGKDTFSSAYFLARSDFHFTTDANGLITGWQFRAAAIAAAAHDNTVLSENTATLVRDVAGLNLFLPVETYLANASVSGNPGTWTSVTVPEPASLGLLAISLGGLGMFRRKHRRT